MRKRTLFRLKERFLISITPIPKVWVRVKFRADGSWHWDFGYKSYEYLTATGQYWDENGKRKWTGKSSWSFGHDCVVHSMWRYIQ